MHQALLSHWSTTTQYEIAALDITPIKFMQVSNLLLERPNLNSSHLFRADILFDSAATLQTVDQKERLHSLELGPPTQRLIPQDHLSFLEDHTEIAQACKLPAYSTCRTVIRRLIPRKPQVDKPLLQSCLIYGADDGGPSDLPIIVMYIPHAASEDRIPWYHPRVRALAYQYQSSGAQNATISIYYQPFSHAPDVAPDRLHRTLLSLLQTFARLSKLDVPQELRESDTDAGSDSSTRPMTAAALKDTILPQHVVQNTYSRLKQVYAADLITRWVENTDPSKHVFEDLSIAAFLIELWGTMYRDRIFPGFIDMACGNGVLVYILIKEGFRGHGYDARRRKTWDMLDIDDYLEEKLCIPKPYLDCLTAEDLRVFQGVKVADGIYDKDVFIISNHADELTPWTPILAALSCIESYLPFLAIPCCSHALSGARHRYSVKEVGAGAKHAEPDDAAEGEEQPSSGDLKAMRARKAKAASQTDEKSTYACLTRKTANLAIELGFKVEMTLLRIPSTRNIGIIGNRHDHSTNEAGARPPAISTILERECKMTGGIHAAAKIWVERAKSLTQGTGRGKVNSSKP